jgi:magnesium chelatase subunit D
MQGDAATIAALFAVDPVGLGGVALRAGAGRLRDEWLALLRSLLPAGAPLRRVPINTSDTALLGGLDLGATLQAGRPVALKGLLAQGDGGVLLLAMAERISAAAATRFCAVLDTQAVVLERDGLAAHNSARLGLVALDEGASDEEQVPASLLERMAFRLVLDSAATDEPGPEWSADEVVRARARLKRVAMDDDGVQALCAAAQALGVDSMRAPLLAARVARAASALAESDRVEEEHIALAARLVLAPRATRVPQAPAQSEASDPLPDPSESVEPAPADPQDGPPESPPPPEPEQADGPAQNAPPPEPQALPDSDGSQELGERILEAAQAAIPAGLLASLKISQLARAKTPSAGTAGAAQKSALRGRPIGARKGEPRAGQRINVLETLRAAAPWQKLRQAAISSSPNAGAEPRNEGRMDLASAWDDGGAPPQRRIQVRKEDFHVARFRQLGQTTTVFVVDASGSAALNRLAEAKGAVELLLADCYVRRDSVAVLAFRGKGSELLLSPTRSLARAKRSLAGLPGGGGTPLASGIDAARLLAEQIRRKGETPIVVFLTDGRGNIARDGSPGRAKAAQDARAAAAELRTARVTALLVDTSPQAHAVAQQLAADMGAQYFALPYASGHAMSQAVSQAVSQAMGAVRGRS